MKICTPLRLKAPKTNDLILNHSPVVPIVTTGMKGLWGVDGNGQFGSVPNFNNIDEKLSVLGDPGDAHLHCLVNRINGINNGNPAALKGRIVDLGMQIVDRYAHTFKSMTLCQELTPYKELWPDIIEFYSAVKAKYPWLRLYMGTHTIRTNDDQKQALELVDLLGSTLNGFVITDYYDLGPHPESFSWRVKALLASRINKKVLGHLTLFIRRLQSRRLHIALETGVKADAETRLIKSAQEHLYDILCDICKEYDTEALNVDIWPWWISDEASVDFMDWSRKLNVGMLDKDLNVSLNTKLTSAICPKQPSQAA